MTILKSLRSAHWVIIAIGVAVAGLLAWSFWAELDQVTRAPGKVIPQGRVQIVQSAEGGVLEAINVREGDRVRKGDVLVELDTVKLAASAAEARARVAALTSRMARIHAELFDRPLAFPPELAAYPQFTANQQQLHARRRAALQSEIAALNGTRRLMAEELSLNEPLVATGDVARSEVIRMRRGMVDVSGRISSLRAQYLQDLQTEFARTEEELVSAEQELKSREDSLKSATLTAPTDGIVKNVRLTTLGGVLRPSDEVLQIVPTGETLVIEAQVPPRDIAFVKVGQEAAVKFDAYDSSIYRAGIGRVTYISPDTLTEDRESGSATYYRVTIAVDISQMTPRKPGELIAIQPGMTAISEIRTGQNTVFRYLTKPLFKTVSQSLGER
ncbi:MAG: HlyD family efflux transporter periplasmic adaptor subunit [Novosphingobium sp.]